MLSSKSSDTDHVCFALRGLPPAACPAHRLFGQTGLGNFGCRAEPPANPAGTQHCPFRGASTMHQCIAIRFSRTRFRADRQASELTRDRARAMSADREATGIADETPRGTRAAKACRRCHRKKLRCFGGHPCSSCKKAHQSCDFGESSSSSGPANGTVNGTVKEDLDKRFKDLETLVHGILDRVTPQSKRPFPDAPANNSNSTNNQYLSNYMPSPSQSCLLTGDETGGFGSFPTGNGDLPQQPDLDLRLSPYTRPNTRPLLGLPEVSVNETIDDLLASSRSPPTPSSLIHVRNRNQGSAEGRLALLAQVGSRYSAPLRPLSFQPAHWENADHTRPPSPTRDSEEHTLSDDFWNAMEVRPGLRDDPLGLQWIDQVTADRLVSL